MNMDVLSRNIESARKKYSKDPAPNIFCIKKELMKDLEPTATYTHNGQECGVEFKYPETNIMFQHNGNPVFLPKFDAYSYRGQNIIYNNEQEKIILPCVPNVFRIGSKDECLSKLKRTILFENKITELNILHEELPFSLLGLNNYVTPTSHAQHYGMITNLLDLTFDFDVASFFATTLFDSGKYRACKSGTGVIYIFNTLMPFASEDSSRYGSVEFISKSTKLPRAEKQFAFALNMKSKDDMNSFRNVVRLLFTQDLDCSEQILSFFNGGLDLFPDDDTNRLVNRIKNEIEQMGDEEFSEDISKEARIRYKEYFE